MSTWVEIAGAVTAVLGMAALLRGAWRLNKRLVAISIALAELTPSDRESIKDAVDDIGRDVRSIDTRVTQLELRPRRRSWP